MSQPLRILITGFGSFPGAPFNPTPALVARLVRLRRPAFDEMIRSMYVFDVSYAAVDRDLPRLLSQYRPDGLVMFGLAARTPWLRIEKLARNAVTQLWPDAAHTRMRRRAIAGASDARDFGPHTARLVRAAQATGIDARASRDAGSYLCNYLCWRALEACDLDSGPALATFIHVPLTAHDGGRCRGMASRMSLDEMTDAGEAILLETLALTRRALRQTEQPRLTLPPIRPA